MKDTQIHVKIGDQLDGHSRARYPELVAPVNTADRAYIAGILDGEGTIYHIQQTRSRVGLKVSMTDRSVIDYLLTFGGYAYTDERDPSRKPIHNWYLTRGVCVYRLLKVVLPYMLVQSKRERASEFLANGKPINATYKMTQAKADQLRVDWGTGRYTQRALGKKYGIAHAQVWRILRGKQWGAPA